jgi:hypothetical protein
MWKEDWLFNSDTMLLMSTVCRWRVIVDLGLLIRLLRWRYDLRKLLVRAETISDGFDICVGRHSRTRSAIFWVSAGKSFIGMMTLRTLARTIRQEAPAWTVSRGVSYAVATA